MKKIILLSLLFLSACMMSAVRTFNLQAAIDAAPNGGTVNVPRGVWEGDAVIPAGKTVHITGVSPAQLGQSPKLGDTQWDWLLQNYPDTFINGSILRGHITIKNASKLSMSNLNMIGHGTGTAIELIDNMGYGGTFTNISIGNYETGLKSVGMYNLTIDRMQLAGVGTGLVIKGNLVRLRDVDIINCTLGADLQYHISWQGGSVQNCTDGIKFWNSGGYLGGIWFEANTVTALAWDGYGGQLLPNFYAADGGNVVIYGTNNNIDLGWVTSAVLSEESESNIVTVSGGELIDNGWNNKIN